MRTNAEIDHGAAAVHRCGSAIGDFGLDYVNLEGVVLHHGRFAISESFQLRTEKEDKRQTSLAAAPSSKQVARTFAFL